jgi:hypothetical protein
VSDKEQEERGKEFDPDLPVEEQEQPKPNGHEPAFDDMARKDIADTARMADAAQLRLTDLVFNPDDAHLSEMTDVPTSHTERIILAEFQRMVPDILASNGEMDAIEELMKIRHRVYRARGRKLIIDAHKFMTAEKDNSKEVEDKWFG